MRINCLAVQQSTLTESSLERYISLAGWFVPQNAYYLYDTFSGVNTGHFFFNEKEAISICESFNVEAGQTQRFEVNQLMSGVGGG